jgi:hypothetical protein
MICGEAVTPDQEEALAPFTSRNYIRCLRLLKDSIRKEQEKNVSDIKKLYNYAESLGPNIKKLAADTELLEEKLKAVQSMINFLKKNLHKFEQQVCDNFLKKHGLIDKFNEIRHMHFQSCEDQLDLSSINSFTSESNLIDISQRDLLRTIDSSRPTAIKGTSNLKSVLNTLNNLDVNPSKSRYVSRRIFSPQIEKKSKTNNRFVSIERQQVPNLSTRCFNNPVSIFSMLYVGEVSAKKGIGRRPRFD